MTATAGTRRALLVDAFAPEPLAGSPVGVIPDADGLSRTQQRAIATELGAATTAFVHPSEGAPRHLRLFAPGQGSASPSASPPASDGDLAAGFEGAVIATIAQLATDGAVDVGEHTITVGGDSDEPDSGTDSRTVELEVTDDTIVWLTQTPPTVRTVDVDYDRVGGALGIDPATLRDIGADLQSAVASTGEPFLLVPVNFLSGLRSVDPDRDAIASLCEEYDAGGVYAFTFDTLSADATLHARAFVPGDRSTGRSSAPTELEQVATPAAAGACGAYLDGTDAFDEPPEEMIVEQGHSRDRPSQIRVRPGDPGQVGGRALLSLDGSLVIPPDDDDDILEA